MHMAVARDIAGAAGAGADRAQCLLHGREDGWMLPHAEIIVRAPHRHLGADAVVIGAREAPAAPLQIGEHAIPPLGARCLKALVEEAFVIHRQCASSIPGAATWVQSEFRNATRSAFSWSVKSMSKR